MHAAERFTLCLVTFLIVLVLGPSTVVARTVLIDDADMSGAVVYSNGTKSTWRTQDCSFCGAKPLSRASIFAGTWHDATTLPSDRPKIVNFTFTGTSVFVYGFTVSATDEFPTVKNQDMSFTLDGQPSGSFQFVPDSPDYQFNVTFFSKTELPLAQHTLSLTVNTNSLALIDYFEFTDDEPEVNTSQIGGSPQSSQTTSRPTSASDLSPMQSSSIDEPSSTQTSQQTSLPGGSTSSRPLTNISQSNSSDVPIGIIAGSVVGGFVIIGGVIWIFVKWRWARLGSERHTGGLLSPLNYNRLGPASNSPVRERPEIRPGTLSRATSSFGS